MIRLLACILAGPAILGVAGVAQAADTPQQVYDHKLKCAAVWAAAQPELQGTDKEEAGAKWGRSVKIAAITAGGKVGAPPARVSADIDKQRDVLLAGIHQRDPAKAKDKHDDLLGSFMTCGLSEIPNGDLDHK